MVAAAFQPRLAAAARTHTFDAIPRKTFRVFALFVVPQAQAQQSVLVAQTNLRMQETQLTMTLQMQMQAHEQMAARVQVHAAV